jgi:hypothetical protein
MLRGGEQAVVRLVWRFTMSLQVKYWKRTKLYWLECFGHGRPLLAEN